MSSYSYPSVSGASGFGGYGMMSPFDTSPGMRSDYQSIDRGNWSRPPPVSAMQYGQIDAPEGSFRYKVKKIIGEENDPDFCVHEACVVHIALEGLKLLDDTNYSRCIQQFKLEDICRWAVKRPDIFTFWVTTHSGPQQMLCEFIERKKQENPGVVDTDFEDEDDDDKQADESGRKEGSGGTGFFSVLKRKNEMAGGATTSEWSNVEFWKSPTHSGWLTKQGEHIKTWRKRWFVMKDDYLFWFKDSRGLCHTSQPRGVIPIKTIEDCTPTDGIKDSVLKNDRSAIKLTIKNGASMFFIADSDTDAALWMSVLTERLREDKVKDMVKKKSKVVPKKAEVPKPTSSTPSYLGQLAEIEKSFAGSSALEEKPRSSSPRKLVFENEWDRPPTMTDNRREYVTRPGTFGRSTPSEYRREDDLLYRPSGTHGNSPFSSAGYSEINRQNSYCNDDLGFSQQTNYYSSQPQFGQGFGNQGSSSGLQYQTPSSPLKQRSSGGSVPPQQPYSPISQAYQPMNQNYQSLSQTYQPMNQNYQPSPTSMSTSMMQAPPQNVTNYRPESPMYSQGQDFSGNQNGYLNGSQSVYGSQTSNSVPQANNSYTYSATALPAASAPMSPDNLYPYNEAVQQYGSNMSNYQDSMPPSQPTQPTQQQFYPSSAPPMTPRTESSYVQHAVNQEQTHMPSQAYSSQPFSNSGNLFTEQPYTQQYPSLY